MATVFGQVGAVVVMLMAVVGLLGLGVTLISGFGTVLDEVGNDRLGWQLAYVGSLCAGLLAATLLWIQFG